jgi:hypothetical protein
MKTEITPRDLALSQAIEILESITDIDGLPPNWMTHKIWKTNIDEAKGFIRKWKLPIHRAMGKTNKEITPQSSLEDIDITPRLYNLFYCNKEILGLEWSKDKVPTLKELSRINPLDMRRCRGAGKVSMWETYQIFVNARMFDVASEWDQYI